MSRNSGPSKGATMSRNSGPPPSVNSEASLDKVMREDIKSVGESASRVEKAGRESLTHVGQCLTPGSFARWLSIIMLRTAC